MSALGAVLDELLGGSVARPPIDSLDAWWARHSDTGRGHDRPINRAILGGFVADRLGYAFASGYREALVALLPRAADEGVTILSVTEVGGVKPAAIQTAIERGEGALHMSGEKRWATLAPRADFILVAARDGVDARERPRISMVRVPATREGVSIRPMPPPPFTPEIPHAEISFEGVAIAPDEILPGDGWDDYVKPFRTVEDVYVHAAFAGYAIAAARRAGLPKEILEEGAGLVVAAHAIASEDPRAPGTHVALAGVLALATRFVARLEEAWSDEGEERSRWARDRALLSVAKGARALRGEAAWRAIGSRPR